MQTDIHVDDEDDYEAQFMYQPKPNTNNKGSTKIGQQGTANWKQKQQQQQMYIGQPVQTNNVVTSLISPESSPVLHSSVPQAARQQQYMDGATVIKQQQQQKQQQQHISMGKTNQQMANGGAGAGGGAPDALNPFQILNEHIHRLTASSDAVTTPKKVVEELDEPQQQYRSNDSSPIATSSHNEFNGDKDQDQQQQRPQQQQSNVKKRSLDTNGIGQQQHQLQLQQQQQQQIENEYSSDNSPVMSDTVTECHEKIHQQRRQIKELQMANSNLEKQVDFYKKELLQFKSQMAMSITEILDANQALLQHGQLPPSIQQQQLQQRLPQQHNSPSKSVQSPSKQPPKQQATRQPSQQDLLHQKQQQQQQSLHKSPSKSLDSSHYLTEYLSNIDESQQHQLQKQFMVFETASSSSSSSSTSFPKKQRLSAIVAQQQLHQQMQPATSLRKKQHQ
ncbi:hypothetical protein SAMD00019534_033880 [Acytostelium subglobosum LB1]|uniref:hypothetical protein n=1 Tax=Acytostelium subglobosum LB1 TaxID=1410327 RepID=UPI000644E8A9|nr:hypothetical protein SAMD00019534_033880 [Acytostelium subglobosum LB1]GAM20213.1 hypothetical protein SAMD00019534_033880 [Acytostelium subglobosum LB1]|eukprot:XP_012759734.1 hypothetical protein SAMD00019534_033880 [Acytostelium subglobosum LB1]